MPAEPIRHEYAVHCSPTRAFDVYAGHIGAWWPATYTANAETFSGVRIEGRVGGSVVEQHTDGASYVWGQVVAWEPGERLVYTSTLAQTPESPSSITVSFLPDEVGCRVVFEHGGWNERNEPDRRKFGDWPVILARFVELAERAPTVEDADNEGDH